MGNCIRKKNSTEWGGEDWGSFGSGNKSRIHVPESKSVSSGAEVKIKISKKELEKLLKEADIEGLPVQQVLAHLVKASQCHHQFEAHQPAWTPALNSIPESP